MLLVEHAPSKASVRTEKTKRLRKVVISSQPYVRSPLTDLPLMAGWLGTGPVESENAASPFHALDPVGFVPSRDFLYTIILPKKKRKDASTERISFSNNTHTHKTPSKMAIRFQSHRFSTLFPRGPLHPKKPLGNELFSCCLANVWMMWMCCRVLLETNKAKKYRQKNTQMGGTNVRA